MGFFDKIIGLFKSEDEADVKAEAEVFVPAEESEIAEETEADSAAEEFAESFVFPVYEFDAEAFDAVIRSEEFAGYTVEENVHPSVLDENAHPACLPITYLFSRDGEAVLAVLVMQKNHYRAMIARGTYQILDEHGIKYVRFFKEMKNDPAYVASRIREGLQA